MGFQTNLFSNNAAKIRWVETYTSDGLNRKAVAESKGIVRGFELAAQSPASPTQFRLLADSARGDNVAVLVNANGFAITIIVDNDIVVDMGAAGAAVGTYWICLHYEYIVGGPQDQPRIVVLTAADMAAAPYVGNVVVLGWINYNGATNLDPHPVAGIPNLGVTNYGLITGGSPAFMREIARQFESKGRIPWQSMIRFGRADEYMGKVASGFAATFDWKQAQPAFLTAGKGFMLLSETDPYEGDTHFEVDMQGDGGASPDAFLFHKSITKVKAGDIIKFSMHYKVPAAVGAGLGGWSIGMGIMYLDKDGNMITVGGAAANLLAFDATGAATPSYTYIENEVHVIGNRNIAYAVPFLRILHFDTALAPKLFYFDDIRCELLDGDGPEVDEVPDDEEHVMQPVRSSVLTIADWVWDSITPTQVIPIAWELYAEGATPYPAAGTAGRARTLEIVRRAGPAGPPWPLISLETFSAFKSGLAPTGSGSRHRHALFQQNTPRAWATLRWNGANFAYADLYGFDTAAGIVHVGPGIFLLQFDNDEDANEWIQDANYAVTFGVLTPPAVVGPTLDLIFPSAVVKTVGPPATLQIKTWRLAAGPAFNEADPLIVNTEVMLQVFAAD